jgi:hypothetical protein
MRIESICLSLLTATVLTACAVEPDAADTDDDGDAGLASLAEAVRPEPPPDMVHCHTDADHDGHGGPAWLWHRLPCPAGRIEEDASDCNDHDASFWAYAWYLDADHDGYGLNDTSKFGYSCSSTPPTGYANNGFDCNDNDAATHPRDCLQDDDGDSTWTVQGRCTAACPTLPRAQVNASFSPARPLPGEPVTFTWNIAAPAHCRLRTSGITLTDGMDPHTHAQRSGMNSVGVGQVPANVFQGSTTVQAWNSQIQAKLEAWCDTVPRTPADSLWQLYKALFERKSTFGFAPMHHGAITSDGWQQLTLDPGGDPDGSSHLTWLSNESNDPLYFVRPGHSYAECSFLTAIVPVGPHEQLNLQQLYGTVPVPLPQRLEACRHYNGVNGDSEVKVSYGVDFLGEI